MLDDAELDRRVDILERRDRGEITTEQAAANWASPSAAPTCCWPVSVPRVVPG